MTFVQATFVLATFVDIRNISAVTDPILTQLFWPNLLRDFKGTISENFYWLKDVPCPPDQCVWQLAIKIAYRTGIWLSKALPDGNLALKITYRTWIWLSKSLTGREFGHQISLPDGNLALKYHYRTRICISNIITGHDFFLSIFFVRIANPSIKLWIFFEQMSIVYPCPLPD